MKRGLYFLVFALLALLICLPLNAFSASMTDEAVLGNNRWSTQNDGDFVPNSDSDYDIGASGSEVQTIYVDTLTTDKADIDRLLLTTGTTVPADNSAPNVSGGTVFVTSPNTTTTYISDLTNPTVNQIVVLIGGSNSLPSYISDANKFNLNGGMSLYKDDVIALLVQADDDYLELFRSGN